MYTLLRKFVEWKAKQKGAQIIIYDGASEIEKTRAFAKGSVAGIVMAFALVLLTAPTSMSPSLIAEVEQRERLLAEANQKIQEAVAISETCLNTAATMEETLKAYHSVAEGYQRFLVRR